MHELQRQLKEHLGHAVQPDSIFVSCGGGGLLGGIIIGTQELGWDKTKIVAVESQGVGLSLMNDDTSIINVAD